MSLSQRIIDHTKAVRADQDHHCRDRARPVLGAQKAGDDDFAECRDILQRITCDTIICYLL